MAQRAALIGKAAGTLGRDDPMRRAAEADDVPAGVLADYLEDNDHDASALRAAFGPAA